MGMTPDQAATTEREVETRRDRRCRRADVECTVAAKDWWPARLLRTEVDLGT